MDEVKNVPPVLEKITTMEDWGIIELCDRKKYGGYYKLIDIAGSPFIQLDVPGVDDPNITGPGFSGHTCFFALQAIKGIYPTEEGQVRRAIPRPATTASFDPDAP